MGGSGHGTVSDRLLGHAVERDETEEEGGWGDSASGFRRAQCSEGCKSEGSFSEKFDISSTADSEAPAAEGAAGMI